MQGEKQMLQNTVAANAADVKKASPRKRRARRRVEVLAALPQTGLLKLAQFAPSPCFGVARSTFWKMVRAGIAPQPVRLKPGGTFWKAEDLHGFLRSLGSA
jgi:predicted DNA-binding transcriptional regulator AlpA